MQKILSHQHVSLPVWTHEDDLDNYYPQPSMVVHVQVTVIRTRYRSVFEDHHMYDHGSYRRTYPRYRSEDLMKKDATSIPRNVINDPLVNDPKFREKYLLN